MIGRQQSLKLKTIHSRHANIEYQAVRIAKMVRIR